MEQPLGKTEFWMRVATLSFSLWAIVGAVVAYIVKTTVDDAVKESKDGRVAFSTYVLSMERRVTMLEERQQATSSKLRTLEDDQRAIERLLNNSYKR